MTEPLNTEILTRVTRYNLIRDERMLYIDVHETLKGHLAAPFVAVPNLINIVARPEFQGAGQTEPEALEDCLEKLAGKDIEALFPKRRSDAP